MLRLLKEIKGSGELQDKDRFRLILGYVLLVCSLL